MTTTTSSGAAVWLQPQATAVKTDPFEAAKEARMIVKWMEKNQPPDSGPDMSSPLLRLQRAQEALEMARQQVAAARDYAINRQAAPAREAINVADIRLGQAAGYQRQVQSILGSMQANSPAKPSTFKKQLNRLHVLVQALPTEPQMPYGAAESVLRAICTLLRNIGLDAPITVAGKAEEVTSDASQVEQPEDNSAEAENPF